MMSLAKQATGSLQHAMLHTNTRNTPSGDVAQNALLPTYKTSGGVASATPDELAEKNMVPHLHTTIGEAWCRYRNKGRGR